MADIEQSVPSRRMNPWSKTNSDGQEDDLLNRTGSSDDGETDQQDANLSMAPNSGTSTNYTSQLAALFIIVNVTVGVGLLAMPSAVQTAGIVTAMVVSIFLLVFGTSVAYIVTIGDQSDRIFASLYGPTFCNTWYMNRRFIMSSLTVFVLKPLCSAKTVDFLKYGSFLGIASILFIVYVVISEFLKISHIPDTVNIMPKSFLDIEAVLPVFCFAYQCHLSWVPVVASMKREEKRKAFVTISVGMLIVTVIYAVVSSIAVLTFGAAIADDLTESYPGKGWSILTTIGIVAFKCLVTLPPAFLPARLSIVDILKNNWTRYANFSEPVQRISATFVTLNAALMLALFVPDILVAVNILGCLAVMFVFTLPALAYLNLVKENRIKKQQMEGQGDVPIYTRKDKIKRALSFFIAVFGVIMMIVVLYKSIANMFNRKHTEPLCHT